MIFRLNLSLVVGLILIYALPSIAVLPRHPDEVVCERDRPRSGWYMDTVGDLEGEDSPLFVLYWIYKIFSPRIEADCQVEEFFWGQDLSFGKKWNENTGTITTTSLVAVGDLMARPHINASNAAHLYDDIEDKLFGSDILFGNLETPAFREKPSRGFPSYNLSAEATRLYLGADGDKGFTVVSTANNHVLDQGEEGLIDTLDYLDELGVKHVGSARSPEERDLGFPIIESNGIKTAFLAYTFSTNGRAVPEGREYEVNLIRFNTMESAPDISIIERHIRIARERGADFVAVSLHWGVEFEFYPPRRIIDLGHRIADAGADLILGHHPHILNPLERYIPEGRDQGVPEVLIAYSLGNFVPDSYRMEFQTTVLLHVVLARGMVAGQERVWIREVDYTPVWWYCRWMLPWIKDFRLINIEKALAKRDHYPFLKARHWRELSDAQRLIQERFEPRRQSR